MNNYLLFFKPSGFVAVERCRPKLPLEPKKPTLKLVKKNWFEDLILCFDGLDDERINAKRVEKYNRQMEVYKKELAAYKKQIKHILSSTEMCNFRRKEKERLLKQTRLGQLLSHDVKKGKFEKTFKDLLDNKWGRFISDELEFPLPNGRAYVPDFAYVDAETGLSIDIEIDEPYSLPEKEPIHYVGEDMVRNSFFTDKGWFVVRFAEQQIAECPAACVLYLESVIHHIYEGSDIVCTVPAIPQWTYQDSLRFIRQGLRNSY